MIKVIIKNLFFIFFIFSLLAFYSCQNREWKNPYDPNYSFKDEWKLTKLYIEQIGITDVKLVWEYHNDKIEGFKIDKKISDNQWQNEYAILTKNIKEWIDTNAVFGELNTYRIYTFAGESKSSYLEKSIKPIWIPLSDLHINQISCYSVGLNWIDICEWHDGYIIDRKIGNNNWEIAFGKVDRKVEEWIDTNVEMNKIYFYRIYAYLIKDQEVLYSASVNECEISTEFNGPMGLSINSISYSEVQLEWIPHHFLDVIRYKIERSIDGNVFKEIDETSEHYFYDIGLLPYKTYNYRIRASSEKNISEPSEMKIIKYIFGTILWSGNHSGCVYSVNFSPDNTKVVSCSSDQTVKIWDSTTGDLIWTGKHLDWVHSVNFSPDNSKVVSGSRDNTFKVWDASTGDLLWTGNHSNSVTSVNFSPDNSKVVSGSYDETVKVWDSTTGNPIWMGSHSGPVNSVNFSYDGNKVISGAGDNNGGDIKVWDSTTGNLIWTGSHSRRVNSVNFSADNSRAVSESWQAVFVWDLTSGNLIWTGNHSNSVTSVNFSPDNTKVISGAGDDDGGEIKVWDSTTGSLIWTGSHSRRVNSVNFSSDNNQVISSGETVKVWDSETGNLIWMENHSTYPSSVNFSPDNSKIVSGCCDGTGVVKVWDISTSGWQVVGGE